MSSLLFRLATKPFSRICSHSQLIKQSIRKPLLVQQVAAKGFATLGAPLTVGLTTTQRRIVGAWLLGTAGMCFVQVALGGITRLTESGLSMVDWNLIKGIKPPITQSEWEAEFEKYKQFPEYKFKQTEREMTLGEFKFIWSMEYLHRMWGRTIGLVFIIPAIGFWAKGWLSSPMKKRVLAMGTLLIGQGLYGWYMVKSGLDPKNNSNQDIPRVSQYRLAGHLSMAVILYTMLLWSGLGHVTSPHDHNTIEKIGRLRALTHASKTFIFLTLVAGAFVAGLDAGLTYNSWPKYADRWIPEDVFDSKPLWKDILENPTTVQFNHRNLAYVSLALVTSTWLAGRKLPLSPRAKMALHATLIMAYTQATIGISTLVHHVPVHLAAIHQSGSMVLISFIFWLSHEIRRIPK